MAADELFSAVSRRLPFQLDEKGTLRKTYDTMMVLVVVATEDPVCDLYARRESLQA